MDSSDPVPAAKPKRSFSAEAIIGTGVTIAAIGVLFLLLGWAQAMRQVESASWILLAIGAVCVALGAVVTLMAPKRKDRTDVDPGGSTEAL